MRALTFEEIENVRNTYMGVLKSCPHQWLVDFYYHCLLNHKEDLILADFKNGEEWFREHLQETTLDEVSLTAFIQYLSEEEWELAKNILQPLVTMPLLALDNKVAWDLMILGHNQSFEKVYKKILRKQL